MIAPNPLPTVADELLCALPEIIAQNPSGATVKMVADQLGLDAASARAAMSRLNLEGRATLMRRRGSREQYLVPNGYRLAPGYIICANCGLHFDRPSKSKRRCCSRGCGIAWSWLLPGVKERRVAGIRAERATLGAKARAAKLNEKRWARPDERKRLSEWNKKRWSNPAIKADLARAIRLEHSSAEKRKFYSDHRKRAWADPATREKYLAGIRKSKRSPEARAKFSALLKARWQDPVWRKKYMAAVKKNAKKNGRRPRKVAA